MKSTPQRQDAELLAEINAAVAAANAAETKAATAQAELVSRSKTVGLLLLEAKKLHPAVKDFEAFLKGVQGLHLSRAYDLLRLAGGRTTDEELKKEARERKQKSRAKKKLPSEPDSVTPPYVTETPEKPEPQKVSVTKPDVTESSAEASARCLAEFTVPCRTWLPLITVEADRQKARLLVVELTGGKPKVEAA